MSETPNVANHNVNPGGHGAGRAVPLRSRCAAATGFASRTTSLGHCVCAREGGGERVCPESICNFSEVCIEGRRQSISVFRVGSPTRMRASIALEVRRSPRVMS